MVSKNLDLQQRQQISVELLSKYCLHEARCSSNQLIKLDRLNRYFQDIFHEKTLSLTFINQPWKAPTTMINGKEIASTCIEAQRSQAFSCI